MLRQRHHHPVLHYGDLGKARHQHFGTNRSIARCFPGQRLCQVLYDAVGPVWIGPYRLLQLAPQCPEGIDREWCPNVLNRNSLSRRSTVAQLRRTKESFGETCWPCSLWKLLISTEVATRFSVLSISQPDRRYACRR